MKWVKNILLWITLGQLKDFGDFLEQKDDY